MAAPDALTRSTLGGDDRSGQPDRVQVIPLSVLARIIRGHQDEQRAAAADHDDQQAEQDADQDVPNDSNLLVDLSTDRYDVDPVVRNRRGSLDPADCALAIGVTTDGIQVAIVTERGVVAASYRRPSTAQSPTPPTGEPVAGEPAAERMFAAVCAGADAVLHAVGFDPDRPTGLRGVGVLVAGRIDQHAGSVECGPWHGFPLGERLAEQYDLPVALTTPAPALLASEHWRGAARGRRGVLAIDWDREINGALALGDRLLAGTTGNAGHIGHICVDPYGPKCACGARGCLQAVAGGAAICEWYSSHGGIEAGNDVTRIARAAGRGDAIAQATLRRAGEAIGQAVAAVVTLLDLDVVVIGGPLGALGPPVLEAVGDGYAAHAALGYAAAPRVVPAVLGQESVPLGAAAAVLHPQSYRSG
ncbi:ROK family protein [Nakamurella sp. A5-74]|uniref:ROK family protein n=1 Tax=Nakamurella sp. A5-74 TaxID=3158264 RepID=A0AAU8DLM3_9ACTN